MRFAAEPPQDALPAGRWAETLTAEFLAACLRIDSEGEALGDPGEIVWFPDRTWNGRTYVPASVRTDAGYELFGYVSFVPPGDEDEPSDFFAEADFTAETAEANPDWAIDLSDWVIGSWRGELGKRAAVTLVWGVPLMAGTIFATAELADLVVDQCQLLGENFTLIAPDDYRGDTLEIAVYSGAARELARESLYTDDGEDDGEEDEGEEGEE